MLGDFAKSFRRALVRRSISLLPELGLPEPRVKDGVVGEVSNRGDYVLFAMSDLRGPHPKAIRLIDLAKNCERMAVYPLGADVEDVLEMEELITLSFAHLLVYEAVKRAFEFGYQDAVYRVLSSYVGKDLATDLLRPVREDFLSMSPDLVELSYPYPLFDSPPAYIPRDVKAITVDKLSKVLDYAREHYLTSKVLYKIFQLVYIGEEITSILNKDNAVMSYVVGRAYDLCVLHGVPREKLFEILDSIDAVDLQRFAKRHTGGVSRDS